MNRLLHIFVVLLILILLVCGAAHAAPPQKMLRATSAGWSGAADKVGTPPATGYTVASVSAAESTMNTYAPLGSPCQNNDHPERVWTSMPNSGTMTGALQSATDGQTLRTRHGCQNANYGDASIYWAVVTACPGGVEAVGGQCPCPAGQSPDITGTCTVDCESGKVVGVTALHPDGQWTTVAGVRQTSGMVTSCMTPPGKATSCVITSRSSVFQQGTADNYTGLWRYEGTQCAQGATSGPEPDADQPTCTDVDGNQVCKTDSQRCIEINGETACYSEAGGVCAANECIVPSDPDTKKIDMGDGARITKKDAPTPPVPNQGQGKADQPAPPTGTITGQNLNGDYNYYSYYNNEVVNNSCADDPDTTVNECTGTGGDDDGGDGEGDGECTDDPDTSVDECSGEKLLGNCPIGQDCGFTVPTPGEGFGELGGEIEAAQNALKDQFATIRQELAALTGGGLSGGSASGLPCTSFTVFGAVIPFCFTEYESALSVIALVITAAATFLAAMIIMRAD